MQTCKLKFQLFSTTAGIWLVSSVTTQTFAQPMRTQVIVDVQKGYRINGHEQIQDADFGVTAYQGATRPVTPTGAAIIRQAGISVIGFPGVIKWCAPAEKPADGAAGIERWYKSDEARQIIRDRPLNGDRYEYGRILPACRAGGVEPMVYLLGGPDWILGPEEFPNDEKLYAALVTSYVGLLREFDPHLRLFHLDNEPNAHWWKISKDGKDYGHLFQIVAKALHEKFPDISIGGPVLLWPPAFPPNQPGQPNWYTWPQWTAPFLDSEGGQSDFFDFHHYDSKSREDRSEFIGAALEEVNLICNEMTRRGKPRPVAITECGMALTEDDWKDPTRHWRRRTFPWAHYLIALLDRPDKVRTVQIHDMSAIAGEWYKFLADDNDGFNMSKSINPQKLKTQPPTYWLYWLMRHTRGTRLVASEGRDLTVFATRRKTSAGDEAAVFLINDKNIAQSVEVKLSGTATPPVAQWDRLYLNDANAVVHDTGNGDTVSIPPGSLAAVYAPIPVSTPLKTERERLEILGDAVLQEFPPTNNAVVVPINLPETSLKGADNVSVYVGVQGNETKDEIEMILDDKTYPLKGGVFFQKLPLQGIPAPGKKDVRFVLKHREGDHRLRISTVSFVIERTL